MTWYTLFAIALILLPLIVFAQYTPKHGKDTSMVWTPSGGSSITLNVQDHSWKETIDKFDVTYCSISGGTQALLAGILRGAGSMKMVLDGDLYPWAAANLVRAGTSGVLTQTVASGKAYTLPVMITEVGNSCPHNGGVMYDVAVELNGLAGVYARPT